jgi:hypothetical protein
VGTFGDVARYGQQRDTATLEVVRNDATAIEFELTDRMKDEIFDYPLTVKVRLPDSWQGVQATQGNAERRASMVDHEGARFALVDAVPDRGRVVLQPSS